MKINAHFSEKVSILSALILWACFITFTSMSCSSCTKPQSGSISGTVTLVNDTGDSNIDPVDYSGVTVALYKSAILDTALVRINDEYPQIGVQISQHTDFDHRDYNPITTVSTDAAGSFNFDKVKPGTYNLVFMKETWGICYIYDVTVSAEAKSDAGNTILYPATILSVTQLQDITFKSRHHYLVDQDCSIMGNVVIEPQALISIAPAGNLRFYGNLVASEITDFRQAWKVNSSKDISALSQAQVDPDEYFASMVFYGSQNSVRSGIISHVGTAVSFMQVNGTISNMYISQFNTGLSMQQCALSVENVTMAHGSNTGIQVISDNSQCNFSNCVLYKQNDAMNIYSVPGFSVSNSYFIENNYAIRPDRFPGVISHNAFERNNYDIFQFQVNQAVSVTYNDFFYTNVWSIFPRRNAVINNNNFFHTQGYFIWIRATGAPPYSMVDNDIDATDNHWAVSDIGLYIQDADDNGDWPNEPCPHYVNFLPKRNNRISEAGIQ